MAHDYVNQQGRNDPYRRKEDPYARNNDPYRRTDDQYKRNDDPYKRSDDPYKRSDDPYKRNDDPYRRNDDPYRRNDDPYKRTEDPYKRNADPYQRNEPSGRGFPEDPYFKSPQNVYGAKKASGDGFRTDSYRSSGDMDGYNAFGRPDPAIYEVDHLVTFDVSPKLGVKNHKDGMERLKHMELTSGVWTMRHLLSVDDREVVITEKATRKELECFPISRVLDPVNITSSDLQEIYNNIVIFIVQNENSKNAAEMHIFQCIGKPGQDLIDDIEAARMGKFPRPAKLGKRQSVSSENSDKRRSTQYDESRIIPGNRPSRFLLHSPASRVGSMALPEEMEADVELLNRCFDTIEGFVASLQQAANAQKKLEKAKAEGALDPNDLKYLTDKSRAPPAREFVDTFQKFKLALNLLPRLKAALKDPNAQELTHLLFAPLSLVIEASREPDGQPKLAMSVTSPLLNRDTCILLDSSLHANEIDLWRSLGDCWNIPADMWKGPVPPPYVPRFYDNTKPARLQSTALNDKNLTVPNGSQVNGGMANGSKDPQPKSNQSSPALSGAINEKQEEYLKAMKLRKAKAFKVAQGRVSKNPKELTVTSGEFVEVLEDTKKWWKVSNINNDSGFVPSTILIVV